MEGRLVGLLAVVVGLLLPPPPDDDDDGGAGGGSDVGLEGEGEHGTVTGNAK